MRKIRYVILEIVLFLLIIFVNPIMLGRLFAFDGEIESSFIRLTLWLLTMILFILLISFIFMQKQIVRHLKKNWKNYLFLVIWVISLFVLAEISLNVYYHLMSKRDFSVYNYEFNYTVHLNSHHYRDSEFVREKGKDQIRIFLIGDSMVYGAGVKQNETIDKYLERELNNSGQEHYEVYNLGEPGVRTEEYYRTAKKFREYKADMVIMFLTIDNDIQTGKKEIHFFFDFFNSLKIVGLYDYIILREDCASWTKKYKTDEFYKQKACEKSINPWLLSRAALGDNQVYYDGLADAFNKNTATKDNILAIKNLYKDVPFILVLNPSEYQVTNKDFYELGRLGFVFHENKTVDRKLQDEIISWCVLNNITYVDILPYMKINDNLSYFHPIDGHYNSEGNYLIAKEVYNKLKNEGFLKHNT